MKRALLLSLLIAAAAVAQPAQQWEPYSASLQSRAAAGDASAQFQLGEAFRTGNGIGQDREQAIAWYRKAAPTDPRAADALGVMLFVKGERKQAIPLLQGAAGRRNDYALYILGTARFNGDYVPKDIPRAYADMRVAAATLPQAQRSLGLMEPYITPIDRLQADRYAAQPGGPEAGAPSAPVYAQAAAPKPLSSRPPVAPPSPVATVPAPSSPTLSPAVSPTPSPSIASPTPTPASGPATIQTVDLPPSQPAPSVVLPPKPSPTVGTPVVHQSPSSTVAPPRSAPKPATPAPAVSGNWRVQLGAYSSEAVATAQWAAFAKKVPALAALKMVTQPVGALTRLQATGIASRDAAAAICTDVTAAKGPCLVLGPVAP